MRFLPHFDGGEISQSVTFRLADSLPRQCIEVCQTVRQGSTPTDAARIYYRRVERYLDQGLGSCHLRERRIASLVQDALRFFDGSRYQLHVWVVMPNHVHALFTPMEGYSPSRIIHSWKSYTATAANKILGRSGPFWQREYHDRFIRDDVHFCQAAYYIEENPVKAGLCATREKWPFSSAYGRES